MRHVKYRKGQKVVLVSKAARYPEASDLDMRRGALGIVRVLGNPHGNFLTTLIGVEWIGYKDGNSLDGALTGAHRTNGWYTEVGALRPYTRTKTKTATRRRCPACRVEAAS